MGSAAGTEIQVAKEALGLILGPSWIWTPPVVGRSGAEGEGSWQVQGYLTWLVSLPRSQVISGGARKRDGVGILTLRA